MSDSPPRVARAAIRVHSLGSPPFSCAGTVQWHRVGGPPYGVGMIDIAQWMAGYETAWASDDAGDIAALFTEDAEYLTRPYAEPIRGRDAIVAWWIDEDEPSAPSFTWHPIAQQDDTAVIEGRTVYPGAETYRNIWILRFEGDRCASFTEWWMVEPAPAR